jgi:hypothetical protein
LGFEDSQRLAERRLPPGPLTLVLVVVVLDFLFVLILLESDERAYSTMPSSTKMIADGASDWSTNR